MKVLLVITYLAHGGDLSLRSYEMEDMEKCTRKATEVFKNVKAGRVSTVCWRVKK